MSGGKKTAKAPDYKALAELTGESSKENTAQQTYANRPDQNTPFGQTQWTPVSVKDPSTGKMVTKWTQNTTLDPDAQRALDANQGLSAGRAEIGAGMLDRIQKEYGPVVDYGNFADKGGGVNAGNLKGKLGGADSYMGKAGDALMAQFKARMDPQFQQQQAQLDTTLRNRGLNPGDEAYDREMANVRQGQSDQFNQSMYQAQQLSAQEANRMQGMDSDSMRAFNEAVKGNLGIDLDVSKFADYQRNRDAAEEMQKRGWSLNEANAVTTGTQVGMPNMPQFQGATKAETTDYSQAGRDQYSAAQDAAAAANAGTANLIGAVTAPMSMAIPS